MELRLAKASAKVGTAGFTRHSAKGLSSRWVHPPSETPEQESYTEIGKHCYTKDLLGHVASEQSQLSESETVTLFEDLVTSGLAWNSTGAVSRTASMLIRDGRIKR